MDEPKPGDRRTVMIRDVDLETWTFLREEAERRRWRTAPMLELIVREWRAFRTAQDAEAVA